MGCGAPGRSGFWAVPGAARRRCSMRPCDIKLIRRELEEYRSLQQCVALGRGWRERALEQKLARRTAALAEAVWQVTCALNAIPDPELRLIFELRYFRGLTWEEVAEELPTKLSPDGARMKHDRYIKKQRSGREPDRWADEI